MTQVTEFESVPIRRHGKLLLSTLQKGTRMLVRIPMITEPMWFLVVLFGRFAGKLTDWGKFPATFDQGTRIWVSLSDHIESQIFWQGVQEGDRGEVELLKKVLKPNHVFFDIGANIGAFSLIAAKRLTNGQVHAFEPSGHHLDRLYKNLKINRFRNVRVNPLALAASTSLRPLYVPYDRSPLVNTGRASLYPLEDELSEVVVEYVASVCLDDYVKQNSVDMVDVLKIDVQGAEMEVLEGGLWTLKRFRPLILMELNRNCLHLAGRSMREVISFWTGIGYSVSTIKKRTGELVRIDERSRLRPHQNICCCPSESTGEYLRFANVAGD